MQHLLNAMKTQAAGMDAQHPTARYGTVQSVKADDCTVRVLIQPEAVLSGWLPVLMPAAGPAWGVVALPSVGQQVLMLAEYGDAASLVVIGAAFSHANPPPRAASAPGGPASTAQPGEVLLIGAGGGMLRLCADGTLFVQAVSVRVAGNLVVQGDVADAHGSLDRLRQAFNQHIHAGVQPGSANTNPPVNPDPE